MFIALVVCLFFAVIWNLVLYRPWARWTDCHVCGESAPRVALGPCEDEYLCVMCEATTYRVHAGDM